MRLFGYNFENTDKPSNWVQVNQEFMNMPIEKLHLQRVHQKKKSKKKSKKRKSKRKQMKEYIIRKIKSKRKEKY